MGKGNVFSLFTFGGVPISHNALQHYPECYGADTWGGVPGQVQLGGYPYPIMLCNITQNSMGQTPGGGTQPAPAGGVPCQVRTHGTLLRGYPGRVPPRPGQQGGSQVGNPPSRVPPTGYPPDQDGGTLLGGYPGRVHPPGQVRMGGGYPVRTTEGVLTTRWAVCLLRSRRRTFLLTL